MKHNSAKAVVSHHEVGHGSVLSYTAGFLLSILLTSVAFMAVADNLFTGWAMVAVLIGLAITQLIVQLVFFLHLGRESKPRWNMAVFIFMILVVMILVVGTLWIMQNLDYSHAKMTPTETDSYIIHDEGISR